MVSPSYVTGGDFPSFLLLSVFLRRDSRGCTQATSYGPSKTVEALNLKADFQSVQFSKRAEILLFTGENVALKLNR